MDTIGEVNELNGEIWLSAHLHLKRRMDLLEVVVLKLVNIENILLVAVVVDPMKSFLVYLSHPIVPSSFEPPTTSSSQ